MLRFRPGIIVDSDALLVQDGHRFPGHPDPVTLEAEHEVVFVVDQDGRLKGLITLHDLLRAQASLGD